MSACETFRPFEQNWGIVAEIHQGISPYITIGALVLKHANIVLDHGEYLPNPEVSAMDLDIIRRFALAPMLTLFDVEPPMPRRVFDRLALNIESGCWELPVYKDPKGIARYGIITSKAHDAPSELAHRFMYRQLVGQIDRGLFLDHRCLNKACCYPRHLEPVTPGENTRRARLDNTHKVQPQLWQAAPTL